MAEITDRDYQPAWPQEVLDKASGIALLRNVPVWYELWRNINGFPPDYYKPKTAEAHDKK